MNGNIEHSRPIPPFLRWCSATIPAVFSNSMTYYETLCSLCNWLQTNLVDVVNNNATVTQQYIDLVNNLKAYVENYFDNLDVQDEINNKLDAMVEDGTLEDIINQEIFGNINARLSLLDNKKFVFVGDSYAVGWTPDGDVVGWPVKVKNYLGLSDSQVIYALHGGYGFHYPSQWFSLLIDELDADNTVTDVVVCGGYNDTTEATTYEQITAGINAFKTSVAAKFPNAHIHIGFIGNSSIPSEKNRIFNARNWYYENTTTRGGNISYLNNVEYSLCSVYDSLASDGKHPNETGQTYIAMNIKNAILTGSADVTFRARGMSIELNDTIWSGSTNLDKFSTRVTNGVTTWETDKQSDSSININSNGFNLNCNGSYVEIGDVTGGHIIGNDFHNVAVPVHCIVNYKVNGTSNRYVALDGNLLIEGKKLYIRFTKINSEATNFDSITDVRQIQIPMFSKSFQTLFC